jgi:hypothetical protein
MVYVHFYVALNQVWLSSNDYIYYVMYNVRNESLQTEICDNVTRNNNTDHSQGRIQGRALCRFNTSYSGQNRSLQDESFLYIITNSTS